MIQPPARKLDTAYKNLPPAVEFLLFVLVFVGIFAAGNVLGWFIGTSIYGKHIYEGMNNLGPKPSADVINALWILQIAGTSLPILLAPIIFGWRIMKRPVEFLLTNKRFPIILMAVVFCIMLVSSPLIEWLSAVNEKMVLPKFLSGIQKMMRDAEDQTSALENAMFDMPTVLSMIKNVLFVGLFTAVAEELMFRGVLQTIFIKWTGNVHVAVWLTGFLFSAFHFQFFGFLPRFFLGVIFGYFVVWSGSIWPAVWAHFLNNGSAIVVTYLYQHKIISVNPDNEKVFNNPLYIISLVVVLFLLFLYKYLGPKPAPANNGEQLG